MYKAYKIQNKTHFSVYNFHKSIVKFPKSYKIRVMLYRIEEYNETYLFDHKYKSRSREFA